jgi:hypothetical protein
MNLWVGVICGASTGRVFAVINPDEDSELDNPRWLLIKITSEMREPLRLLKLGLHEYMDCKSPEALQDLVKLRLV